MTEDPDWICTVKWIQATPGDGAWLWTLSLIEDVEGKPELRKLVEGIALNKLGVYWRVWRQCRKRGLRFRPWPWSKTWVSGKIE